MEKCSEIHLVTKDKQKFMALTGRVKRDDSANTLTSWRGCFRLALCESWRRHDREIRILLHATSVHFAHFWYSECIHEMVLGIALTCWASATRNLTMDIKLFLTQVRTVHRMKCLGLLWWVRSKISLVGQPWNKSKWCFVGSEDNKFTKVKTRRAFQLMPSLSDDQFFIWLGELWLLRLTKPLCLDTASLSFNVLRNEYPNMVEESLREIFEDMSSKTISRSDFSPLSDIVWMSKHSDKWLHLLLQWLQTS